jgi:pimeloyl-ACP methyl ester carboxylesterase
MPKIPVNTLDHYYEQIGEGPPLVFIHGAFGDLRTWDAQWQYFASRYRLLRYDLRGHGKTGPSKQDHYTIDTFADDLATMLDQLDIQQPVICGQSFGGIVAQALAVQNRCQLAGLVLVGSMVAIDLTLSDKLLCNVLFPKWIMLLTIRTLSARNFTRFSLWLAYLTKGKHFLGNDPATEAYLKQCMFHMENREYLKIWDALYDFHLLPLENISCPTLVLNGEHEPKSMIAHTRAILRLTSHAKAELIPASHHASNMDNPPAFNQAVQAFLDSIPGFSQDNSHLSHRRLK